MGSQKNKQILRVSATHDVRPGKINFVEKTMPLQVRRTIYMYMCVYENSFLHSIWFVHNIT